MILGVESGVLRRLRLRPRMLRGVKDRDMTVTVLGRQRLSMPLGIAPSAMQRMAHPDGEEATAKAAEKAGTVMILSTLSTTSMEDVRKAAPHAILWYQLYVFQDRELTRRLVKRAEQAGYSALVLTVDAPVFGRRVSDVRKRFSLPSHLKYVICCRQSPFLFFFVFFCFMGCFEKMHLINFISAEDAVLAVRNGIPAIIVSNHGGRQLDGVASTVS
ncbi:(S)-2-hydroxy-acid oxidase, putative [Ixodes scapularis]|uniref:(S)-2-hydroxy-acid oxidase, putative n=1 Tax=Ixodes scapularis TaxID=6945 RepID=B7PPE8_IXOSC|nr:(S)-2-hydroxy-acid oxidase, putative [Ixodes scapularis]|eukprot:XP_002435640.1 (S)-2-hydroxy-acid oxidase, putative [Ixodes scapularis]